MAGEIDVIDERNSQRTKTKWTSGDTGNVLGPSPLVASHSLIPYGEDTVGWLVGGPSYPVTVNTSCRSIAFVPVRASYP